MFGLSDMMKEQKNYKKNLGTRNSEIGAIS